LPGSDPQPDHHSASPSRDTPASSFFLWLGRFVLLVMLVGAPWWFGAVSQTAQSCLLLLGVAGMTLWWFSLAFGGRSTQLFPYLAFPVVLGLVLIGIQMLPLSEQASRVIAPRQAELYEKYASPVVGELLQNTDSQLPVTPRITMDLDGTAEMFNLLMLALICLMLGCHFFSSRRAVYLLPLAMTVNGVAISLFAIVQRLRSDMTIYGFVIDDIHQPFGPFVNKNNAAGYLLLCLAGCLAVLFGSFHRRSSSASRPRPIITNEYPIWKRASLHIALFVADLNARKLLAMAATLIITAGVLFTISRGGILSLGVGLAMAGIYFCVLKKSSATLVGLLCGGLLLIGFLGYFGAGEKIAYRLGSLSNQELLSNDQRATHWVQTAPAIGEFSPLGSGVGSYLNVHRLYRLDNEKKVFYFAENQYFQTLVEAGFPGLFLLLGAIGILAIGIRFIALNGKSPKTAAVCLMGMFLLPSQAIAATFDFGLFIPANTILMAAACGFIAGQTHALADRQRSRRTLRLNVPRFLGLILLLLLFTASLFSLVSCHRRAVVERNLGTNPQTENYATMPLADTEQRIEELKEAVKRQPDSAGLLRLAELYVYRYRMQLFGILMGEEAGLDVLESDSLDQTWLFATGVDRLHNMVYQAWRSGNSQQLQSLISDPLVKDNLLPAVWYLKLSRARSPLQPSVHLLLAQLHSVSPTRDADVFHLQRSMELAPANSMTALICGILNLQAGRTQAACENLRKCLQIEPANYIRVISVAVPFLPAEKIANEILPPDDPIMLYQFALKYMAAKSMDSLRLEVFERVLEHFEEAEPWDRKSLEKMSDVQERLGDIDAAIETQKRACDLFPALSQVQLRLAKLYERRGKPEDLEAALERVRDLQLWDQNNPAYKLMAEQLRKKIEASRWRPDDP
jgi:tetratricopeptide (TPR) repeat protein